MKERNTVEREEQVNDEETSRRRTPVVAVAGEWTNGVGTGWCLVTGEMVIFLVRQSCTLALASPDLECEL